MLVSSMLTSNRLCFGNTIKPEAIIKTAQAHGIDLTAFDCEAELDKIARAAPGQTAESRNQHPNFSLIEESPEQVRR